MRQKHITPFTILILYFLLSCHHQPVEPADYFPFLKDGHHWDYTIYRNSVVKGFSTTDLHEIGENLFLMVQKRTGFMDGTDSFYLFTDQKKLMAFRPWQTKADAFQLLKYGLKTNEEWLVNQDSMVVIYKVINDSILLTVPAGEFEIVMIEKVDTSAGIYDYIYFNQQSGIIQTLQVDAVSGASPIAKYQKLKAKNF